MFRLPFRKTHIASLLLCCEFRPKVAMRGEIDLNDFCNMLSCRKVSVLVAAVSCVYISIKNLVQFTPDN